jgi:hypothetical protein
MRWIASSGSPKIAENGLFEGFLKIINRSRAISVSYPLVYATLTSRHTAISIIARGVVARYRNVQFLPYSIMKYG